MPKMINAFAIDPHIYFNIKTFIEGFFNCLRRILNGWIGAE
jgi:hypothetical protein